MTGSLLWIALAAEPSDARSAARLAGAVDGVRQKARLAKWPVEVELRPRFEQPFIEALGESEWARERTAGTSLTLEEAIDLARTLGTRLEATTRSA